MKLIYLDRELAPDQEHELFSNTDFGFLIEVKFTPDILKGQKEVFHNVTEVHSRYDGVFHQERIAFESDIHGTGSTYDISNFESVIIKNAEKIYENF